MQITVAVPFPEWLTHQIWHPKWTSRPLSRFHSVCSFSLSFRRNFPLFQFSEQEIKNCEWNGAINYCGKLFAYYLIWRLKREREGGWIIYDSTSLAYLQTSIPSLRYSRAPFWIECRGHIMHSEGGVGFCRRRWNSNVCFVFFVSVV